nr:substrate-binding domain-containing protein [Streptomyces lichenis]
MHRALPHDRGNAAADPRAVFRPQPRSPDAGASAAAQRERGSDVIVNSSTNAHTVARRLLDGPDRPSAVFCVTDDQAIGLLRAAAELGIRVPEDLAVVAFDDIAEAVIAGPPLTTVASAQRAMARAAVDLAWKAGPPALGEEAVVPGVHPARPTCRAVTS